MKKVFFSAAMSLLLLAGFSSCKNDDPEPPKPPVVEDVLGSYSAENLALTVTGGTPVPIRRSCCCKAMAKPRYA